MKKFLSSITMIAGVLVACNSYAQTPTSGQPGQAQIQTPVAPVNPNDAPIMKFERDTIDYGTVPHNADGYRSFKFTNVGKEPLIIKEAHGSCGCTVPTFVHEPIQPGQQSEIKVHYATDRVGGFTKTVTLTSNAYPSTKVLVIKGTVLPDPAGTTNNKSVTPTTPVAPAQPSTTSH